MYVRELGQEVFWGTGTLEEMPYLSKATLSSKSQDKRIPIRILVRDNEKLYALFFFHGREKGNERQRNIEELVRGSREGAKLFVTGAVINRETLEQNLECEEPLVLDASICFGLIKTIYKDKEQIYTYYMDFGDTFTKDTTILMKGDYITPRVMEMDGLA